MSRSYWNRLIGLTVIVFALLLVIPSLATATSREVAGENLIENGDLELIEEGWPVGFGRFSASGSPVYSVDETSFHSGSRSISIGGNGNARAGLSKRVLVEGGKSYRLTVWYRATINITRSDVVGRLMAFKTETGHSVDYKIPWEIEWVHDLSESSYRKAGNNFEIRPIQMAHEDGWQALTVAFTLPEEVVRLEIDLFNWLGNGTVWFDDLSLVQLPDQPASDESTASTKRIYLPLKARWPEAALCQTAWCGLWPFLTK